MTRDSANAERRIPRRDILAVIVTLVIAILLVNFVVRWISNLELNNAYPSRREMFEDLPSITQLHFRVIRYSIVIDFAVVALGIGLLWRPLVRLDFLNLFVSVSLLVALSLVSFTVVAFYLGNQTFVWR